MGDRGRGERPMVAGGVERVIVERAGVTRGGAR